MPTATFRGASVKHYHGVPKEGIRLCRMKVQVDYSDAARSQIKRQDWQPLPPSSKSMKLDCQLAGGESFSMSPNGMPNNAVEHTFVSAQKFEVVRVKTPTGGTEDVLRFEVLMNTPECVSIVDHYVSTVGEALGVLKLKYSEQANTKDAEDEEDSKQPSLIEVEEEKPRRGPKAKVN